MATRSAIEARVRRAAKRVGLVARKSTRAVSLDNRGGFMLVDRNNWIVEGSRFDLTAQNVIALTAPDAPYRLPYMLAPKKAPGAQLLQMG